MSTIMFNVIVCVYYSLFLYGHSAATNRNNLIVVENVTSESVKLSLKSLVLPNTTCFHIILYKHQSNRSKLFIHNETRRDRFDDPIEWRGLSPSTKYSVRVEILTEAGPQPELLTKDFKTRKERPEGRHSTTPYKLTRRAVVIKEVGEHRSGDAYMTTDGGHRGQSNKVDSQTTYPVTTSSKSTRSTEFTSFTDLSKSSIEQGREIIEERELSPWGIEETTLTQSPETTEITRPETTEMTRPETTEMTRPKTTEITRPETTEMTRTETFETQRTETTKTQRSEITQAVITTRFLTEQRAETPDNEHDKVHSTETPNLEAEKPSVNGTITNAIFAKERHTALDGLIWWLAVVGGAGLGMIILFSILTVLFYRPWRRNKSIQMRHQPKKARENVYGKMRAKRTSSRLRGVHSKNSCYGKISEKECADDERYQRTQSVFSWGTEFDSFDPMEEEDYQPMGDYANTCLMLTQTNLDAFNNSATSSAELLGDSSHCYGSSDI